ncbi:MAG: carbohydrate ABC transporter permease [Devosia sp.]
MSTDSITRVRRRGSTVRSQVVAGWLFLAPSLVILAVFVFWPIIQSVVLSLHQWRFGAAVQEFVGAANYEKMWKDPRAWNALKNTVYFTAFFVPLGVVIPLALALLLNRALPLRTLFRAAIFLPVISSFAIVALAWRFLLDPDIGLLTYWVSFLGLPKFSPLRDPDWAMPAVIVVTLWKNIGFNMVIYLAGLQAIPPVLYEAARIDGASSWQQFWNVTWPQLKTTNVFVLVISIIGAFQVFDPVFVLTPNGGPLFSTETLVSFIYRQGITQFNLSYAAAVGFVLFVIVLVLTLIQMWLTRTGRD